MAFRNTFTFPSLLFWGHSKLLLVGISMLTLVWGQKICYYCFEQHRLSFMTVENNYEEEKFFCASRMSYNASFLFSLNYTRRNISWKNSAPLFIVAIMVNKSFKIYEKIFTVCSIKSFSTIIIANDSQTTMRDEKNYLDNFRKHFMKND